MALAAISESAHATTLASFDYSDGSSQSTDLGSFGAGYSFDFSAEEASGALSGSTSGSAYITLFGKKLTIADASASASINDTSSKGVDISVKIVGQTVVDRSYSDGLTYSLEGGDADGDGYCTEFFDESADVTIVVVPVTMTAGATGCAKLDLTATPSYDTTNHKGTLTITATPGFDVGLSAAVGLGTSAFSAGVEGDVTLVDVSVPITLDPWYKFDDNTWQIPTTGTLTLNLLDGSVKLYAKADLGLFDVKYTYKLFSWSGITAVDKTIWTTGTPTATNASVAISGGAATGTYTYQDTAGTAEKDSSYTWYRNSVASDTGRSPIYNATGTAQSTYQLSSSDGEQYLKFCVKARNSGQKDATSEACSNWVYVGKIASYFQDSSYGGSSVNIAFEKSASDTCFNLNSYLSWFDNDASSFKLNAPTNSSATFHFYKAFNCDETTIGSEYQTRTVAAGGTDYQTGINALGSNSWNDRLSSVKVTYTQVTSVTEEVSAEDVSVSISGNTASSSYSFISNTGSTDTSSTYIWYRSPSSSGAGATTLSNTSKTYTLTASDDQQYLMVCVTPSSGTATGSQVCSGWTGVGHLLKLYSDYTYGGRNVNIAYEKSSRETCFNLSTYSFNDITSSFQWSNNSVAAATVWLYKEANCTGTVGTHTISTPSGSESVSNISTSMGTEWNDAVSSVKVSWFPTVWISNVSVSISGNKAGQSHTYSDSAGLTETSTYTWYRADDASGQNATAIGTDSSYTLTTSDENKYLGVCVFGSNAVNVATKTMCSTYASVGHLATFYSGSDRTGTSISIAYENSPSGTCFVMANYGFNDLTSSADIKAPTSSDLVYSYYQDSNCTGSGFSFEALPAGKNSIDNYGSASSNDNQISSVKFTY